ncbi:exodeoxyribonuclease VII large subunit [Flavobacterium caseinilyticum]|uniref:Exodeoxyribonuclease 7 large subunit n=1 Tax=Flavobacterium caseinilyticum TaxID=2541732 RepID=A0A4R5AR36_9FLAO|nr:exodeoxyribonuclease VII large subunit [Flavobacterium caseinilyticum]TDD74665.1 exodeoxyribonuclease VII large subunit [Flavobacterium caseinilyticum]
MPEKINDKTIFSLLEVTNSIKKTLEERYKSAFWIKAEMNKLNHYSQSGHCFPELVEKRDGKIIAQIKSTIWRDDYQNINRNFLRILKEPLKDGIKILFLAKISFDPAFGLSLQIIDIDPQYTLGDLENEKRETIKKLQLDGIYDKNKNLQLSFLPQRIAIISVATSKGFGDFLDVIDKNSWNYKFFYLLFPTILQGDKAVHGIISQLERIRKVIHHFDAVAIIRGGGGDVGLSCYNNYELAKAIAVFPIPVITGIGHVTNETVCEMIAHTNAITPTKLAEYLIQKFHDFSVPIQNAKEKIVDKSRRLLSEENTKLESELKLFRSMTINILNTNGNQIKNASYAIQQQSKFIVKNNHEKLNVLQAKTRIATKFNLNQLKVAVTQLQGKIEIQPILYLKNSELALENIEKNIQILNPINVLKRGFSITHSNGKAVKDVSQLQEGEVINTVLFSGTLDSIITKIKE